MSSVTDTMQLYILDPLWDSVATKQQIMSLHIAGYDVIVDRQPKALCDVPGLFDGRQKRVLAINPDYVGWSLKAADYQNIPGLVAVLLQSTSFSWVEPVSALGSKIPVCNIRNFSTESVAEWAIMTMLLLARRVPEVIKAGFVEDYEAFVGQELRGKTVGIVGMGHIGKAIAARCQGLGMHVAYWSRNSRDDRFTYVDLPDVFKANVVFPAMADNDQSRHIITPELLQSMPSSSLFVSVVHHYYDHALLLGQVKTGKLAGYGFEDTAGTFASYQGNICALPAYAWCTNASKRRAMDAWVSNMLACAAGEVKNRVL